MCKFITLIREALWRIRPYQIIRDLFVSSSIGRECKDYFLNKIRLQQHRFAPQYSIIHSFIYLFIFLFNHSIILSFILSLSKSIYRFCVG